MNSATEKRLYLTLLPPTPPPKESMKGILALLSSFLGLNSSVRYILSHIFLNYVIDFNYFIDPARSDSFPRFTNVLKL